MPQRLQPLRIPAGWLIELNALYELDPSEETADDFGVLFSARNEYRRFWIGVEWLPELDPSGCFHLLVEYAPWERTEGGRRRDRPPHRGDAKPVHEFQTRSRLDLVRELDEWLTRCSRWVIEGH